MFFTLFLTFPAIGFSQSKSIEKLSAAPNPFTTSTNITINATSNSKITLNVINVLGKIVFKKEYTTKIGKNNLAFYKDDLATGIYIYSIRDKKEIISKRFVIK
ncbi:T9SS type A sorting domain-containing protein [Polaribacter sp.]|uniref:T9SS type A sorting domain-containing protein n=1 Tax=Polaribacter sp. TaxID=1920175 RepID=UPI0025FD2216|nr:T9SS type A sorting domain-containing protein [Polaribacter sp.]